MNGNAGSTHLGGEARSVGERLEELKERGCIALATGQVPADAMQAVTRHMFGDPDLDRRRLFVTFEQITDPNEWFPGELTVEHDGVELRNRSESIDRAAVATQPMGTGTRTPSPDGDLFAPAKPQLDAVTGDVVDVAMELPSRRAGQLRVVVHRPDYLITDPDPQSLAAIESFVERFRVLMQRFGGMGLLVVAKSPDDAVVDLLVDVVDLHFKVRKEWSFVEQQVVIDPGSRTPLSSAWHKLP